MMQNFDLNIRLGCVQSYKNIDVLTLFNEIDAAPVYLSLKEAFEQNKIDITEVSEGGNVPTLKAFNKADIPILIIDGEEPIGAKQNRIVNTTILLEVNSESTNRSRRRGISLRNRFGRRK